MSGPWDGFGRPSDQDCWHACLLACHRDDYEAICDAHYDELVGGVA